MKKSKIKRLSALLMSIILIIGLSATTFSASAADYVDSESLPADGSTVSGSFSQVNESKYYKIILNEDGKLDLTLSNLTPSSKIELTLHNENFSKEYSGMGEYIGDTPKTFSENYYLYKGVYYAKVKFTYPNNLELVNYEISANLTSANSNVSTPNETTDSAMPIELNNRYSTILEEKVPKNFYKLTLDTKKDLTLVATPTNDIVLRIFDSDLAEKYIDRQFFSPGKINVELDEGIYYVEFGDNGGLFDFSIPCFYSFYLYETEKGDPFVPTEPIDTKPTENPNPQPDTTPSQEPDPQPDTTPTKATQPTTKPTTIPTKSTDPTSATKNATSDTPSNGSNNSNSSNGAVQTGVISVTIALTLVILISGGIFFIFKRKHKIG